MARTIYAKNPEEYIPALAEALKQMKEFEIPEWAYFVKTGSSKERPPANSNFWHIRAASILRQLYLRGVIGVGKLRTKYGSRKDRGGRPDKFKKAGGKIIRTILQQAEAAELVEKISKLQHGRRLTEKGRNLLDSINIEEKKGLDFDSLISSKNIDQIQSEEMQEELDETKSEEDKS